MQETWDFGSTLGLEWSHGERQGNPLLYSCLENPTDRGVWRAICPSGCKELAMIETTSTHAHQLLFSHPAVSNSLRLQRLQHTRPPCPSPSPRVCPSACPLHQWCHPATSSSNTLFSFCFQFFSASGSFPMSQLFASGDQNIGAPASALILPISYSGLIFFKIDWFDLLAVQGTLWSLLQHHSWKASVLQCSAFFTVQLSQTYVTTGKIIALTIWTFIPM